MEQKSIKLAAEAHVLNPTTHTRAYFEENGFEYSNRACNNAVATGRFQVIPENDRDYSMVGQLELGCQPRQAA